MRITCCQPLNEWLLGGQPDGLGLVPIGLTKVDNKTPASKQSVIRAACSATNLPIRGLFMVLAYEIETCLAYHNDIALCYSVTDDSSTDHQLRDGLESSEPSERLASSYFFSTLYAFILTIK